MKPCVTCGKMLPDAAKFCTGCGSQQTAAGQEAERREPPRPERPVQQMRQQMPPDIPMPNEPTPAPAPAVKEKKRGFRARTVVIPLVLAVLAAAGVFVWRALQHPSEIWEYNEDDELVYIEYYDGADVVRGVEYDGDEEVYIEEYRETAKSRKVDTDSVAEVSGVKNVRAAQVFYGEPDQKELDESDVIVVFGNDWRGRVVVYETYYLTADGEYVLLYVTNYERDVFGNMTHVERTGADGTLVLEGDYENHYSFGRVVSRDVSRTTYGYANVEEQGEVEIVLFDKDEIREVSQTYEMHY